MRLQSLVAFFLFSPLLSSTIWAEEISTNAPQFVLPKWNAQLSHYYLNFRGEQGADSGLYDFGKISSHITVMNLNYQLDSDWSLQLMAQHVDSRIESLFPRARRPEWRASNDHIQGFGDTNLTASYRLKTSASLFANLTIGVSVPTGTIDNKNTLPGLQQINMAYNAQLGSGTWDGLLGATALWFKPNYQLGSRFLANLRTGTNNNDYRLGNQYRLDLWLDYPLKYGFTPRLTGYYRHRDGLSGADRTRGRTPLDNFFYENQINWDLSAALQYKKTFSNPALALSLELGVPLAQDYINVDNTFVASVFYAQMNVSKSF